MLHKLSIVLLLITLVACEKKTPPEGFVSGDVIAGIKGGTSVEEVFNYMNEHGLEIKNMRSFTYAVPYPANKLDSISAYLNTKPYVDSANWKAKVAYNFVWKQVVYSATFFNMDKAAQADWIATRKDLNLTVLNDTFATVHLRVPEGTEQYWVDELSKNNMIRWAELNTIVHQQL